MMIIIIIIETGIVEKKYAYYYDQGGIAIFMFHRFCKYLFYTSFNNVLFLIIIKEYK